MFRWVPSSLMVDTVRVLGDMITDDFVSSVDPAMYCASTDSRPGPRRLLNLHFAIKSLSYLLIKVLVLSKPSNEDDQLLNRSALSTKSCCVWPMRTLGGVFVAALIPSTWSFKRSMIVGTTCAKTSCKWFLHTVSTGLSKIGRFSKLA